VRAGYIINCGLSREAKLVQYEKSGAFSNIYIYDVGLYYDVMMYYITFSTD